ncbi:MAG TPA: CYTH domain-containing protein [Bacillota bacterium]|nr:CYTH domain-containing protein [Bacillota bacterium]
MEIEMKFAIGNKEVAEAIWEDEYLKKIGDSSSKEAVYMKSAYFDTEERVLLKNDVAFRVRMEGNKVIASLKWNGSSSGGLHKREEVNVPVDDPACFLEPSPEIFRESDQGKAMMDLIGEERLYSILEMNFVRRRIRVDYENSIMEIAVDTGEILTENGELPICELEIELFSGEQEDVTALGNILKEKYDLFPLDVSKYARGLKFVPEDRQKK